jgi:hypothetical protein
MGKLALTTLIFTGLMAPVGAIAQSGQNDGGLVAPELSKPTPGHLLNQDYLTPTGETVPRPGVPQSSGPTPEDRSMQHQDNQIDKSICSNC